MRDPVFASLSRSERVTNSAYRPPKVRRTLAEHNLPGSPGFKEPLGGGTCRILLMTTF